MPLNVSTDHECPSEDQEGSIGNLPQDIIPLNEAMLSRKDSACLCEVERKVFVEVGKKAVVDKTKNVQ